jgi:hypothetical protein
MGEMKNTYTFLIEKPVWKIPLGRPRCRWEGSMNVREIGWECVDWMRLAQDRDQWWALVNTVMNFRVP